MPAGGLPYPPNYFGRPQGGMAGQPAPNWLWRLFGLGQEPAAPLGPAPAPVGAASGLPAVTEPIAPRRRIAQRVARGAFGDQPVGRAGGQLSDRLRSPGPAAAILPALAAMMMPQDAQSFGEIPPVAPVAAPAPQVDAAESFVDPLANPPMIPSLQNEPQIIARQLAGEVEAGKMGMAEAVQRYRALRFGGR